MPMYSCGAPLAIPYSSESTLVILEHVCYILLNLNHSLVIGFTRSAFYGRFGGRMPSKNLSFRRYRANSSPDSGEKGDLWGRQAAPNAHRVHRLVKLKS